MAHLTNIHEIATFTEHKNLLCWMLPFILTVRHASQA